MLDYLEKYNQLPQEIRDKMSAPAVMSAIDSLEKKYGVSLAVLVMKIMTKDVDLNNIARIQEEIGIDEARTLDLIEDFKKNVFAGVPDYLGLAIDIQENESEKFYPPEPELPEEKKKRSDFLFSVKDEEEIKKLAENIKKTEAQSPTKIAEQLENIIKKSKINFGSDELKNRFKQIVSTYLRGIRNRVEVKQALIKSFESGGLGFDEDLADCIVSIANGGLENKQEIKVQAPEKIKTPDIEKEKKEGVKILKQAVARDVEYNLAAELKKKDEDRKKVLAEINRAESGETRDKFKDNIVEIDSEYELAPPPPAKVAPIKRIKVFEPKKILLSQEKIREKKTEERTERAVQPKIRTAQQKGGKIKMEDVKQIPKVMSPIDELKYMDLTVFRRLGETPGDIVKEIREKLNLLESESYAQRLEGIKAWRNSPVNKMYLDIGQQSIGDNKAIDDIIKEKKTKSGESLTSQEFEAIMDLNRSLRF